MSFNKSLEYLTSIKQVCNMLFIKSKEQKDNKLHFIAWMVLNYFLKYAKDTGINPKEISDSVVNINIAPIMDYITVNNISLFDLSKINADDLNVNDQEEIERFILSHLSYIYRTE